MGSAMRHPLPKLVSILGDVLHEVEGQGKSGPKCEESDDEVSLLIEQGSARRGPWRGRQPPTEPMHSALGEIGKDNLSA